MEQLVTVVVLEHSWSKDQCEKTTTIHSAVTRPYEQAMERATDFIKAPVRKIGNGWESRYLVGVYSIDGGIILDYGGVGAG